MADQQQQQPVSETSAGNRRRLRPSRIVKFAIGFLILGAIVNIAVAWGFTRWGAFAESITVEQATLFFMVSKRGMLDAATRLDGHGAAGNGIRMVEGAVQGTDRNGPVVGWILVFDAGWPFLSLRAEWRGKASDLNGVLASISLYHGLERLHPFCSVYPA